MLDFVGVAAVVDHAEQKEESAGGDAVSQHLEDGAVHAGAGEAVDAQHHEAEVADRGVGDQLLHVGLDEGDQRSVDDADDGQGDDPGRVAVGFGGEESDVEAQQAVGAHLEQDSGEQHRARGGRLDVGIRQPGVEGEDRNLDGEGQEESEEEPEAGVAGHGDGPAGDQLLENREVEGSRMEGRRRCA